MIGSSDPSIVAMLLGAMATLGTVIGVLYKNIQTNFKHVTDKLSDCEKDRYQLWRVVAKQAGASVEELKKSET